MEDVVDNSVAKPTPEFTADKKSQQKRLLWGMSGLGLGILALIQNQFAVGVISNILVVSAILIVPAALLIIFNAIFAWSTWISITNHQVTFKSLMYNWVAPWNLVKHLEILPVPPQSGTSHPYREIKLWGTDNHLLGQIDLTVFMEPTAFSLKEGLTRRAVEANIPIGPKK